jgi:aryl-alcohol dehydrogenase-like predicted oxidoreductase
MHIWDGGLTPVDEVDARVRRPRAPGKILYAGVSDTPAWWVAQANTLAELSRVGKFVGLQIEYSLAERTVERELVPMAKALGLTITAGAAGPAGVLSGSTRRARDRRPLLDGHDEATQCRNRTGPTAWSRHWSASAATSAVRRRRLALAWLRPARCPSSRSSAPAASTSSTTTSRA